MTDGAGVAPLTPQYFITQVFRILLKRDPTEEEVKDAMKFMNDMVREMEGH